MTKKDEVRFSLMCEISMALKSPKLQQGFEIICKNLSELEKENAELKEKCETLEDMLDEGISYQKAKDYDGVVTSVLEQNHQLTKAISLINRLSEYIVLSEDYWKKEDVEKQKEILREAEQFLKVVSE